MTRLLAPILLGLLPLAAAAANTPCSQSKGGVAYCLDGKFICRDGTMSASKRTCVAADWPPQPNPDPQGDQHEDRRPERIRTSGGQDGETP